MDEFLKSFSDTYEKWRTGGGFSHSSKVIPVHEALSFQQLILTGEEVLCVLSGAESFALTDCLCRTHYRNCDNPRDVCFLLDDFSDRVVARNKARRITLKEAKEVLKKADEHGLVHLALYMPGQRVYALCSCCACCCHDLRLLLQYHRTDLVARSGYAAITDEERCNGCGRCVGRCLFGARRVNDGLLEFDAAACMGCGLCVSVCPEKAVGMQKRPGSP